MSDARRQGVCTARVSHTAGPRDTIGRSLHSARMCCLVIEACIQGCARCSGGRIDLQARRIGRGSLGNERPNAHRSKWWDLFHFHLAISMMDTGKTTVPEDSASGVNCDAPPCHWQCRRHNVEVVVGAAETASKGRVLLPSTSRTVRPGPNQNLERRSRKQSWETSRCASAKIRRARRS
jgi:hypothetical protein